MQTVHIQHIYFQYPDGSQALFEDVDVTFEKGWSALIGANGSGKSTLLKLISKELYSDTAMIKGNDLVYYCHQSTEFPPKALETFMTTYTSKAFKLRELLEIEDAWLDRWDSLSHGERKRLQLAVALFSESDVLLVDEPSNHLDAQSKAIVTKALKSFKGIGILVSHDRELLDALSENTMMIKNAKIQTYTVNFSLAMKAYEKEMAHHVKMQDNYEEEMKKMQNLIQHQKEKVSQSKKRMSKKHIDPKDSDAREKINMAKLTGRDKNDGQMLKHVQSKQQQLLSKRLDVDKQYDLGISFETGEAKNAFPLVCEAASIKLSDTKSLSFGNLSVDQGDKIALMGENGSGKSSFINYFMSHMSFNAHVLYIPQELTEKQSKDIFKELKSLPKKEKGLLFTLITRLSSDPKQLMQSSVPSPGEIRKLLLAKGLLQKSALIILDEPTNHMDLDSIKALEVALSQYKGTLMIISHDSTFIKQTCKHQWLFSKLKDGCYELTELLS